VNDQIGDSTIASQKDIQLPVYFREFSSFRVNIPSQFLFGMCSVYEVGRKDLFGLQCARTQGRYPPEPPTRRPCPWHRV